MGSSSSRPLSHAVEDTALRAASWVDRAQHAVQRLLVPFFAALLDPAARSGARNRNRGTAAAAAARRRSNAYAQDARRPSAACAGGPLAADAHADVREERGGLLRNRAAARRASFDAAKRRADERRARAEAAAAGVPYVPPGEQLQDGAKGKGKARASNAGLGPAERRPSAAVPAQPENRQQPASPSPPSPRSPAKPHAAALFPAEYSCASPGASPGRSSSGSASASAPGSPAARAARRASAQGPRGELAATLTRGDQSPTRAPKPKLSIVPPSHPSAGTAPQPQAQNAAVSRSASSASAGASASATASASASASARASAGASPGASRSASGGSAGTTSALTVSDASASTSASASATAGPPTPLDGAPAAHGLGPGLGLDFGRASPSSAAASAKGNAASDGAKAAPLPLPLFVDGLFRAPLGLHVDACADSSALAAAAALAGADAVAGHAPSAASPQSAATAAARAHSLLRRAASAGKSKAPAAAAAVAASAAASAATAAASRVRGPRELPSTLQASGASGAAAGAGVGVATLSRAGGLELLAGAAAGDQQRGSEEDEEEADVTVEDLHCLPLAVENALQADATTAALEGGSSPRTQPAPLPAAAAPAPAPAQVRPEKLRIKPVGALYPAQAPASPVRRTSLTPLATATAASADAAPKPAVTPAKTARPLPKTPGSAVAPTAAGPTPAGPVSTGPAMLVHRPTARRAMASPAPSRETSATHGHSSSPAPAPAPASSGATPAQAMAPLLRTPSAVRPAAARALPAPATSSPAGSVRASAAGSPSKLLVYPPPPPLALPASQSQRSISPGIGSIRHGNTHSIASHLEEQLGDARDTSTSSPRSAAAAAVPSGAAAEDEEEEDDEEAEAELKELAAFDSRPSPRRRSLQPPSQQPKLSLVTDLRRASAGAGAHVCSDDADHDEHKDVLSPIQRPPSRTSTPGMGMGAFLRPSSAGPSPRSVGASAGGSIGASPGSGMVHSSSAAALLERPASRGSLALGRGITPPPRAGTASPSGLAAADGASIQRPGSASTWRSILRAATPTALLANVSDAASVFSSHSEREAQEPLPLAEMADRACLRGWEASARHRKTWRDEVERIARERCRENKSRSEQRKEAAAAAAAAAAADVVSNAQRIAASYKRSQAQEALKKFEAVAAAAAASA